MKFFLLSLVSAALSMSVHAAHVPNTEPVTYRKLTEEEQFSLARRDFTTSLLTTIHEYDKNAFMSTFGIHSALSSLMFGAKGETRKQLWNTLGFGNYNLTESKVAELFSQTYEKLSELEKSNVLTAANLFAVEETLSVEKPFMEILQKQFKSDVLKADFIHNAAAATNDVNEWIKTTTHGRIGKLFGEPLSSDTRAVIANALHFKSGFLTAFPKHHSYNGPFHLRDGTTKNVTYMRIAGHEFKKARYGNFYGFRVCQVPFDQEGRLWLGLMLMESTIPDNIPFTSFMNAAHEYPNLELIMPKFSLDQNYALSDALKRIGVTDVFDQKKADLSGIDAEKDLFVSKVAHKANFDIDENGVEAAAATGIVVSTKSSAIIEQEKPIQFKLDSPFMFNIYDSVTDIQLFNGIVYNP